ncbi:putative methyltransferase [Helianthus debilis subsp. tardiflorus]
MPEEHLGLGQMALRLSTTPSTRFHALSPLPAATPACPSILSPRFYGNPSLLSPLPLTATPHVPHRRALVQGLHLQPLSATSYCHYLSPPPPLPHLKERPFFSEDGDSLIDVLHMNDGNGDSSYASNSFLQEHAIRRALPYIKHTIMAMANRDVFFNSCFMIADLGCSSGMNTLLVASSIINIVHDVCQENNRKTPQFQVCLNDLFVNDFNSLFKLLPNFYDDLKKDKGENIGPCFVSAVPGSFYGRLFPDKSLHFVHSSYSIQWLSQVPEGLECNKLNIYISKTSPYNVLQAYGKQFHTDFTRFLQLRYEELVHGGHMILVLPGRSKVDPTSDDCWSLWDLLTISLLELLEEGLVRESDINSFNLPFYLPCEDELMNIIQDDGSFSLDSMDAYEVNWDPHDIDYTNMKDLNIEPNHTHGKNTTKKNTAKVIRAITEPLLTYHFGSSIIDVLFKKYEKHVTKHLAINKTRQFTIVISLTKK